MSTDTDRNESYVFFSPRNSLQIGDFNPDYFEQQKVNAPLGLYLIGVVEHDIEII